MIDTHPKAQVLVSILALTVFSERELMLLKEEEAKVGKFVVYINPAHIVQAVYIRKKNLPTMILVKIEMSNGATWFVEKDQLEPFKLSP